MTVITSGTVMQSKLTGLHYIAEYAGPNTIVLRLMAASGELSDFTIPYNRDGFNLVHR